jgi:hypothetical protein
MAGHSRLKDGVASARLSPAIHVLRAALLRTWMPGTSSAKTRFALPPGHDELNQLSQRSLGDTGISLRKETAGNPI